MNTTIVIHVVTTAALVYALVRWSQARAACQRLARLADARRDEILDNRTRMDGMRSQIQALKASLDAQTSARAVTIDTIKRLNADLDQSFAIGGKKIVAKDGFAETDIMNPKTQLMSR